MIVNLFMVFDFVGCDLYVWLLMWLFLYWVSVIVFEYWLKSLFVDVFVDVLCGEVKVICCWFVVYFG